MSCGALTFVEGNLKRTVVKALVTRGRSEAIKKTILRSTEFMELELLRKDGK